MLFQPLVALALLATTVAGHGMVTAPRKRGAGNSCGHCLNAGGPGAIGGQWSPYEPLKGNKRTGFGICGDPAGSEASMKWGRFGRRNTAITSLKGGSVANFEFKVTANHRGYVEFFLCDVANNPGQDIRFSSFPKDCVYLERVPNASCESGNDPDCGPIDPKFPGRWMFPCRSKTYGGSNGKMAYRIPNKEIKVGVVHAYWLTANSCGSPDGFTTNYKYPASWCKMGNPSSCGGYSFPEEFWNCADVTVSGRSPSGTSPEEYKPIVAVTIPPTMTGASELTVTKTAVAPETEIAPTTAAAPKATAVAVTTIATTTTTAADTTVEPATTTIPKTTVAITVTAAPKTTTVLETTSVSETTATRKTTAASEMATIPKTTAIPEFAPAPETTAVPRTAGALEVTASPETATSPEATAALEGTVAPVTTVFPETTALPEITATTEATVTTEATGSPETTAAPETTIAPETSDAPEMDLKGCKGLLETPWPNGGAKRRLKCWNFVQCDFYKNTGRSTPDYCKQYS